MTPPESAPAPDHLKSDGPPARHVTFSDRHDDHVKFRAEPPPPPRRGPGQARGRGRGHRAPAGARRSGRVLGLARDHDPSY